MKLKATVDGVAIEVTLQLGDEYLSANIGGRTYEVQAHRLAVGEYLLLDGCTVRECRVESRQRKGSYLVHLRNQTYEIDLTDPKRLTTSEAGGIHHSGAAEIVAAMPGKVVNVLVETGTIINAGDAVLVVEAMKMQNELKAPKAGTIEIKTATGATVEAGAVLAVIE
jgi:biotin carboxyl carrier protein